MTSLELHEHMTPEQHIRWMAMSDMVYDTSKLMVKKRVERGQNILEAIDTVDKSYVAIMNLDNVPF